MSNPTLLPGGDVPPVDGRSLAERAQAPAVVAAPPDGALSWRELDVTDVAALTALVVRIEAADHPPYRTSAEEVREYFDHSHHWSALGARDRAGVLRGFGFVRIPVGDTAALRAFCSGGIDPDMRGRGAGGVLMDWQVARARQMLVETNLDVPARIVYHVDEGMDALAALLVERGFAPRRWYTEMRRDLSRPLPEVTLGTAISIESWSPDLDDAIRRAHNKAFADQWGSQPHTPETWVRGRSHFAPSWSFVALDRSSDRTQVAGYLMSGRYEQDWAALGWTEGYTEMIGVLNEWRGRHVATALLSEAMRAYAADGMQYAGLDVDADNPTGAVRLYDHLGYERTRGSAMYTIEL
ncbi:MAG: GNAT family N-acetyltransferase [Georgenia sp.]